MTMNVSQFNHNDIIPIVEIQNASELIIKIIEPIINYFIKQAMP